jgi:hypothetical protein
MRREHSRDSVAHGEIGMPHNPRHGDQWPVLATGTLGCYALHKLRFTNRLHLLRAILAIHRLALDEHGRNDAVPTAGILEQLAQDVAVIGTVPQVVMRITAAQDQEVPQSSTATMPHALLAYRLLGAVLVTSSRITPAGVHGHLGANFLLCLIPNALCRLPQGIEHNGWRGRGH